MADIFLSYARQDRSVARKLAETLEAEGQSVFFDEGALVSGEDWSKRVREALTASKSVVVLLSRNSNRSKWVEAELAEALRHGEMGDRRVIPVLLDDDATHNWVWPLVSDRVAIRVDSPSESEIENVARQIDRALGHVSRPVASPIGPVRYQKAAAADWYSPVVPLAAAVLSSAIVGAVLSWLVFRRYGH